ncbi:MAG TPA: hypothetical protein VF773_07845 [Verrucomicrobiae bacterium]
MPRQAKKRFLRAAVAIIAGWATELNGAELHISGLELFPEGSVKLTFEDTGTTALNYATLARTNIGLAGYQLVLSRVSDVGPGQFQTTLPMTPDSNLFFQVVSFSYPDADADGLSDALETMFSTSTNTFDTDADGFGDANEILNASDPLRSDSVPQNVKVNFASAQSSTREGDGFHQIMLNLSQSFFGQVRYRISHLTTASIPSDFDLSGIVEANGTTAVIRIPLIDDLVIENVEMLVLDLEADPEKYLTGGASRHTVSIHDNDGYWSGVLRNDNSEQGFRLRLLRQGSTMQGAFVSSDDTNSTTGVQGIGTIPPGNWPLATAQLSNTTFEAVSGPIPMGSSTLFGNSALTRVLNLVAKPAPGGSNPGTNYWIKSNLILGTYTDTLSPADSNLAYLRRESTGIFVLMEDLPVLPFPDSPAAAAFRRQATATSQRVAR